jgi:hypothetical protein
MDKWDELYTKILCSLIENHKQDILLDWCESGHKKRGRHENICLLAEAMTDEAIKKMKIV